MLKNVTPRLYQETIFSTCAQKNSLVVLPTGMGKTLIALLLSAQRLQQHPKSKILILAPTRPLCDQHLDTFRQYLQLPQEQMVLVTGYVAPEKRKDIYHDAQVIVSTPQTIEHDLINRRYPLNETSLIVFDEAHRAVKDYSYVWIAKQYQQKAKYERILALTASPGSNKENIQEVIQNLGIEAIEVRTVSDPDVKPYVQELNIEWVQVQLPEALKIIQKNLQTCYYQKLESIKKYGYITGDVHNHSKTSLLSLQAQLQGRLARGEKDFSLFKSLSLAAEAFKVHHALELAETQGVHTLYEYLQQLQEQAQASKSKAVQNLVKDLYFKTALLQTEKLLNQNQEHPKLAKLKTILQEEIQQYPKSKIIVFNQYRDQINQIKKETDAIGLTSEIFIGQAKRKEKGLSQKEQKQVLDRFRNAEFNVLIASSVGEEGLDIPLVDLVVFYEPIPSAIRTIQRRGRTARGDKGRVIILCTKDTRDEGYQWSSHHKEKRMHRILLELKKHIELPARQEMPLQRYIQEHEDIQIYVDHREQGSVLLKELIEQGVKLNLQKLDVGDYLLSDRVAVELKEVPDFVNSVIDGRLMSQLKELCKYERPLLIIQGTEDLYSQRNIHPNALRGMLATIAISYKVPILQTKNPKETAALMAVIAKREQKKEGTTFSPHTSKPITDKELQEYLVSALPGIGPSLAKPLLEYFGSVRKVYIAAEQDLQKIPLIGKGKAKKINEILDKSYDP